MLLLEPRWLSKGKCQINKRDYRAYDMQGCLVWKTVEPNELEKRSEDLGSGWVDREKC
jgi:hypothetical protein